jgi:hypothetical protein
MPPDLGDDVSDSRLCLDFPSQGKDQRHRRIEMRPGNRPKNGDQHHQHSARRDRVAEQRKCHVVGQAIGHDARTDNRGNQHGGAERFGDKAS